MGKEQYIFGKHLIDQAAKDQFETCLSADYSIRGALMADAHRGYSLPIGGVMWTDGVIVPSYVGYDIGCGMQAVQTTFDPGQMDFYASGIYVQLNAGIPTGFKHHTQRTKREKTLELHMPGKIGSDVFNKIWFDNAGDMQIGTMGGNNHYIEIGVDNRDRACFVVHSGSRGIGHKVAGHYMRLAAGGKAKEGNYTLKFDSQDGRDYYRDMVACIEMAKLSRQTMLAHVEEILLRMGFAGRVLWDTKIDTVHNYAEYVGGQEFIHRKGATRVHGNKCSIVAGNPKVGTFIVQGKPTRPCSLDSVSHGMGRVGSRKEAFKNITKDMVAEQMGDVVGKINQDEAPSAYKSVGDVMDAQADLLTIENQIHPVLCLKG